MCGASLARLAGGVPPDPDTPRRVACGGVWSVAPVVCENADLPQYRGLGCDFVRFVTWPSLGVQRLVPLGTHHPR